MKLKNWITGLVLFLSVTRVMPQDQPDWELTSALPLQDIVGEEYQPRFEVLSPDGSAIGWWDEQKSQVCVYTFSASETICYEKDDKTPAFGRFSYPSWSPDGRFFAFTESFFDRFVDSDIWVLDIQSGEITNRTDDQISGNLLGDTEPVPVDYFPTWNPSNGDLYFFRSLNIEDSWSTALYLLPEEQAEPVLITDLSASVPVLSIFRRAAISPDGTRMAVNVLAQQWEDERNGVYLIDLKDGQLTKVAELSDMTVGLPDWATANSRFVPEMLSWAGNDALIVSNTDSQFTTMLANNTVYIDLTSGEVTSLVDFSQFANQTNFVKAPDGSGDVVRGGVVAPDNEAFWALRSDLQFTDTNIVSLPLPPSADEAIKLDDVPNFQIVPGTSLEAFVSSDGKALMFGWLFTFERR